MPAKGDFKNKCRSDSECLPDSGIPVDVEDVGIGKSRRHSFCISAGNRGVMVRSTWVSAQEPRPPSPVFESVETMVTPTGRGGAVMWKGLGGGQETWVLGLVLLLSSRDLLAGY